MNTREVLFLLERGKSLFRFPLRVCYLEGEGDFGVSVPKRHFKRAVKRNLLKRRVREAFRLNASLLGGCSFDIFVQYVGKEVVEYEQIERSLSEILADMASGKAD